jgi:hypothetical protein
MRISHGDPVLTGDLKLAKFDAPAFLSTIGIYHSGRINPARIITQIDRHFENLRYPSGCDREPE